MRLLHSRRELASGKRVPMRRYDLGGPRLICRGDVTGRCMEMQLDGWTFLLLGWIGVEAAIAIAERLRPRSGEGQILSLRCYDGGGC